MPLNHTSILQSLLKFCTRFIRSFFPTFFLSYSFLPDFFLDLFPTYFSTFFSTFFPTFARLFLDFFFDFFPDFLWKAAEPNLVYCCGLSEHCGLISLLTRDIFSSMRRQNGQRFCRASTFDGANLQTTVLHC